MFPGKNTFAVLAIISLMFVSGCGGESGTPLPTKTLSWNPPTAFSDGTPLDPHTDLDTFEIYLNETGPFSYSDNPVAVIAAVNRSTGQPVTNFNLANLSPYIDLGVQYQVALKAVSITGATSNFSESAIFSF